MLINHLKKESDLQMGLVAREQQEAMGAKRAGGCWLTLCLHFPLASLAMGPFSELFVALVRVEE